MEVAARQEVSFTIDSGETIGNVTLSGFDDLDQMVVFHSSRFPEQASLDEDDAKIKVWPTSTTNLRAERSGTPSFAITVRGYVLQMGDDTDVQKSTYSMASGDTTDQVSLSPSITTTESIAWASHKGSAAAVGSFWNLQHVEHRVSITTTTIDFERWTSTAVNDGYWFVCSSDTMSVEHVNHSYSSTLNTMTDTFTTVSDLADTFVLVSFESSGANYQNDQLAACALTATNTISFYHAYASGIDYNVTYQVAEDSTVDVRRGDFVYTGSSSNTSMTSLDLAQAVVFANGGMNNHASVYSYDPSDHTHEMWFGSATQINTQVGQSMTSDHSPWQAIAFAAESAGPSPRRVLVISS